MPKALTTHAKYVISFSVALVLFVALCHSTSWRGRVIMQSERFVDTVNIMAVKSSKSDKYAAAGMKNFYSDGNPTQSAIFFTPSINDILCKMGSNQVMQVCTESKTRIENVSCSDNTTLVNTAYNCSRSVNATSKVPVESSDCEVRVLNGLYMFVKSCTTLTARGVPGMGDELELLASGYGTRMLMLMRPVFIAGPLCKLAAPTYSLSGYPNDIMKYDSSSKANVLLRKSDVVDYAITDGTGMDMSALVDMIRGAGKKLGEVRSTNEVQVPLTMYYLNYTRRIDGNFGAQSVLTLFIKVDKVGASMFSMASPPFSVSFGTVENQPSCIVKTARGLQSIPAPRFGVVVVTYTTNLLIMAMVSKDRVCISQFVGQPMMQASPADVQQAIAKHPPPPQVYPYDNTCIPNFADIAIKFGFL